MGSGGNPRGAHLVGSVPLENEEQVFRTMGELLGDRLKRIPDGETGDRSLWISWQLGRLSRLPQLELVERGQGTVENEPPTLRLREGVSAADVDFGDLGYADVAAASFATFARLQAEGAVPADCRFLVALPTPLANSWAWLGTDPQYPALAERYEAAMLEQVRRICETIPHGKLAIQWDVCVEVWLWEGWVPGPPRPAVVDQLVRISEAVPGGVELGYHFCYGDWQHEHLRQPADTGNLVELANEVLGRVTRPVAFVHVPVPIERDDDAYFEPLRNLGVGPATELYLGLVHYRDGVEGARRRIAAASKVVPGFGVATECGLGRRPPERGGAEDTLRELLATHAAVSEPVR